MKSRYLVSMTANFVGLLLGSIVAASACAQDVDAVVVFKAERKLQLLQNSKVVREYRISLGGNPVGHKEREGDQKTPEGIYVLDYKKSNSSFFRAIHVSYPNDVDRAKAEAGGYSPGGLIMIHGQKNGFGWLGWIAQRFDWTDGCIGLRNEEMSEVWDLVNVGTPIDIRP